MKKIFYIYKNKKTEVEKILNVSLGEERKATKQAITVKERTFYALK